MKRRLISLLTIITIAASLIGCSSKVTTTPAGGTDVSVKDTQSQGTDAEKKEDVGSQEADTEGLVIRSSLFSTPAYDNQLYLAQEKGFFKEEFAADNITLEFENFLNGPAANEALIAGHIDIAHAIGDQPMITGIVAGSNATALTTLSRQTSTIGIYISGDSDLSTVESLKGKKIGLTIGTMTHKCVVGILENHGISEDDVELVNLSSVNEFLAALATGDIDAFCANFSAIYESINDGTVKQLVDFSDYPAFTFLVVSNDFIETYPEVTQRLLNVIVRTQKWADENPEEASQIVADFTGQNYDAVYELRSQVDFSLGITEDDVSQMEYTYNFLLNHEYVSNTIDDLSVLYNNIFINEALADAGN